MAEHTPGYVAALAAALTQANIDAIVTAEQGGNQLGTAITKHPGLRIWNGNLLRLGHLPKTPFAVECNVLLPNHQYVDMAHHEHVHLEHLTPPPGYTDDPTVLQWVHCAADADGAVPITIAVTQTRIDDDPET
jgi:hypothetical protein